PPAPSSSVALRCTPACCPVPWTRTRTPRCLPCPPTPNGPSISLNRPWRCRATAFASPSRLTPSPGSVCCRGLTSWGICCHSRRQSKHTRRRENMSRHLSGDDVVQVYDTTLRDGTQREGISLSAQDKVAIARRLDRLGVTFIEGGWPGSNPKDVEFFERAKDMEWQHALIAAFGSTCRVGSRPEDDANIRALLDAATPVCTVVGKTWTLHVKDVLRTTLDENLRIIEESLAYLKAQGRRVIYDAEHFFDGYRADPAYAIETLRAAIRGGAEIVVLCDTNGGSLPWDVEAICRATSEQIGGHPFGIHTHNDGELGVANTLSAVRAGAMHVQGTINGYGERCGNANLCSIIPDLELKMGRRCLPEGHLRQLYDVSHYVAEVANLAPDEHAAYVGRSAFAHKGGIHVAAIRRNVDSYQHIDPALVGNEMRVVVSEL